MLHILVGCLSILASILSFISAKEMDYLIIKCKVFISKMRVRMLLLIRYFTEED